MPFRVRFISTTLLLVAGGLTSCSQHVSPPSTVPVSGVVMLNGKAAPGIRVTMHPQFSMGRIEWGVVGETGPGGRFVVGTGAPGNGAPPGEYIVTFMKPLIISDPELNGVEVEVDAFKGKYSDPNNSEFVVTIERGENELEPFELK